MECFIWAALSAFTINSVSRGAWAASVQNKGAQEHEHFKRQLFGLSAEGFLPGNSNGFCLESSYIT